MGRLVVEIEVEGGPLPESLVEHMADLPITGTSVRMTLVPGGAMDGDVVIGRLLICPEGVMHELPKAEWELTTQGQKVVLGAHVTQDGWRHYRAYDRSELPNDRISLEDLERIGAGGG